MVNAGACVEDWEKGGVFCEFSKNIVLLLLLSIGKSPFMHLSLSVFADI